MKEGKYKSCFAFCSTFKDIIFYIKLMYNPVIRNIIIMSVISIINTYFNTIIYYNNILTYDIKKLVY